MRIFIATAFIITCFTTILFIFWKQEVRFTLPTPKPTEFKEVAIGTEIKIGFELDTVKPTFFHFYNYDCPCSRFNIQEFKAMVYQFKDSVNFIAIVQAENSDNNVAQLFKEKYELDIPVFHDKNGSLAEKLGVYSTPQAVIIKNNQL